jgi:predicted NBD/HSP70 family sugar kinase
MRVLVIDVGGTNVKVLATGGDDPIKIPSGLDMTPRRMVSEVREASREWDYDVISIGFPAPVVHGKIMLEPKNLGQGWLGWDPAKSFGKPAKIINDAAMQAAGSYEGGTMLFLGLGTGLGSAIVIHKVIASLELAHLPYKKGKTFEDYVGLRGLEEHGRLKWTKIVHDVVARLKAALVADYVVLGGGNAKKLKLLPPNAKLGDNQNAFIGGFKLWTDYDV